MEKIEHLEQLESQLYELIDRFQAMEQKNQDSKKHYQRPQINWKRNMRYRVIGKKNS